MKPIREHYKEVIVGIVLLGISSLITWALPGGWETVWTWTKKWATWMNSDGALPRWLLAILWGGLVWAIFGGLQRYFLSIASTAIQGQRIVFELRWRWRRSPNGHMTIIPFCPTCDIELIPKQGSGYHRANVSYECDNPECGKTRKCFEEMFEVDVENLVRRKIQQELRSEVEYLKA